MTKPNSFTITRRWMRFLGVGCSHGFMADRRAPAAVLRFKAAWRPDYTFHLGDAMDTAAYRSGAAGGKDQGADSREDMARGLDFIRRLEPQTWFMGNHEDRLFSLSHHWNAIVKDAASALCGQIEAVATELGCAIVPYRGCHADGFRMLGDYRLTHGYLYNENACRDLSVWADGQRKAGVPIAKAPTTENDKDAEWLHAALGPPVRQARHGGPPGRPRPRHGHPLHRVARQDVHPVRHAFQGA